MIRKIIAIIVIIFILSVVMKLQICLSKKDKKIFGLIIPIFIFNVSLLLAFGGTPAKPEIETTQTIQAIGTVETETDSLLDIQTEESLVDKALTINSIIYTILIINSGNVVMLGIYFYCRHQKKTYTELKRMKAQELF